MLDICPNARTQGIVVTNIADEVVIYDKENGKALCLSPSVANFWYQCSGERSIRQIAENTARQQNDRPNYAAALLAVRELNQCNLFDEDLTEALRESWDSDGDPRAVDNPPTRREFLEEAGRLAAGLTLILSLGLPSPAHAASATNCSAPTGRGDDCPCTANSQCSSGCCSAHAGNKCRPPGETPNCVQCRGSCECMAPATCPSCLGYPRLCRVGGCPPSGGPDNCP